MMEKGSLCTQSVSVVRDRVHNLLSRLLDPQFDEVISRYVNDHDKNYINLKGSRSQIINNLIALGIQMEGDCLPKLIETIYMVAPAMKKESVNPCLQSDSVFKLPSTRADFEKFKGRRELLFELQKHLIINHNNQSNRKRQIVILTGIAGVGKTTLAYHFAEKQYRENKNSLRDGILTLEIGCNYENGEGIARDLIKAYDSSIELDDSDNPTNMIEDLLSTKQILIIFDDVRRFEAESYSSARISLKSLFHALFSGKQSKCSVIVTTRDRELLTYLEIDGYTIDVQTLNENEALELLKEFIGEKSLDKKEESVVRDIVKTIGSLPLAIRIAGSKLKDLKAQNKDDLENYYQEIDIYQRLLLEEKERLTHLALPGSEDDPEWSVEASLNTTIRYLSNNDKEIIYQFFACLSACAEAGISRDLAMAVSGYNQSTTYRYLNRLDTLSLLDRSKDSTSLYIFHPLIHSLARNILKTDPILLKQATERHAKFILNKIMLFNMNTSSRDVEIIKSNHLKALEWWKEIFLQTSDIMNLRDEKKRFKRLLRRTFPSFFGFIRPRYLTGEYMYWKQVAEGLNNFFEKYPNPKEAVESISIFQVLAEDMEDWEACIRCCLRKAKYYSLSGELLKAEESVKQVPAFLRKVISRRDHLECKIRFNVRIGQILWQRNKVNQASKHLNYGVNLSRRTENKELLRNSLSTRAGFFWDQNQLCKAIQDYQELIILSKYLNNQTDLLKSLIRLDVILLLQGRVTDAQQTFDEAISCSEILGGNQQLAKNYAHFGNKLYKLHNLDAAVKALERVATIYEGLLPNHSFSFAVSLFKLGSLFEKQHKYCEAVQYLNRITELGLLDFLQDKKPLLGTLRNLGSHLKDQGNYIDAITATESVISVAQSIGNKETYSIALNKLGCLYRDSGNLDKAIQIFLNNLHIDETNKNSKQVERGKSCLCGILFKNQDKFIEIVKNIASINKLPEKREILVRQLHNLSISAQKNKKQPEIAKKLESLAYSIDESIYRARTLAEKLYKLTRVSLVHHNLNPKFLESFDETISVYIKANKEPCDYRQLAEWLLRLGALLEKYAKYSEAVHCLQFIPRLELCEFLDDKKSILVKLTRLGSLLKDQKDYTNAITATESAVSVAKNIGNTISYSVCLNKLGYLLRDSGNLDEERQEFLYSLYINEINKSPKQTRRGINCLSSILYKHKGKFFGFMKDVADKDNETHHSKILVRQLYNLSNYPHVNRRQNKAVTNIEIFERLICTSNEKARFLPANFYAITQMQLEQDDLDLNFLDSFDELISVILYASKDPSDYRELAMWLFSLATLLRDHAKYRETVECLKLLSWLELCEFLGDKKSLLGMLNRLGSLLKIKGNYIDAIAAAKTAVLVAKSMGDSKCYSRSLYKLGGLTRDAGNLDEAIQAYLYQISIDEENNEDDQAIRGLNCLYDMLNMSHEKFVEALQSIENRTLLPQEKQLFAFQLNNLSRYVREIRDRPEIASTISHFGCLIARI
jgi:tetratricopeptide (TPR) repeat protein